MRFAPLFQHRNPNPDLDYEVVSQTLREAELADALGYDAVWLSEHLFGYYYSMAYGDPLVFASAVAAHTKQVKIGFAAVQLPLYHPVRFAAQTALLDNLSHGRLIVGTGTGYINNPYELRAFGIALEDLQKRLAEAEELVVMAWTKEYIDFKGQHWQVEFPLLRPRPFQKPHPPMPRACLHDTSVIEMARAGRPVLLWIGPTEENVAARQLSLYRDTMLESGFDNAHVENMLDQCWVLTFRGLYLADTDEQAQEEVRAAAEREWMGYHYERAAGRSQDRRIGPTDFARIEAGPLETDDDYKAAREGVDGMIRRGLIAGSPKYVAEKVAEQRDMGCRNQLLTMNFAGLPEEKIARSMRLFAEEVIPLFRKD